jgi:phage major head subunit gpT-like protein
MSTDLDLSSGFDAANTTFLGMYAKKFAGGTLPGAHTAYTRDISTPTTKVELGWLANMVVPRKWRGARIEKAPRSYKQTIEIAPHEATLVLERYDVDYDKTGRVADYIAQFFSQAVKGDAINVHENWVANSGAGLTGFDGVALFSTAHPHGPTGATTQVNLATSTPLSYSSFEVGRYTMAEWKLENGEPVGAMATAVEVGEFKATVAKELLGLDRVVAVAADGLEAGTRVAASTIGNGLSGAFQVIVNERLNTSATRGYVTLLDLRDAEAKPMVMLKAKALSPQRYDQMSDPRAFKENKYIYGLTGDYDSHPGLWMTAYRITP